MPAPIQLSDRERVTVDAILARFADRIGRVRVYGSRALGRARPSSDLDLAFDPPISNRTIYDLMDAFEESDLPITVDLFVVEPNSSPGLCEAIERHGIDWPIGPARF